MVWHLHACLLAALSCRFSAAVGKLSQTTSFEGEACGQRRCASMLQAAQHNVGSLASPSENVQEETSMSTGLRFPRTIWMVWVSQQPMLPLHQVAMNSCIRANQGDFTVRLVTDEDLQQAPQRLGFTLHRSFHLLDAPEKADYLRAELLYHHGGFYLDTDVFCLRSLRRTYEAAEGLEAAGDWNVAILGPFKPEGRFVAQWHELLMRKMDEMTPRLEACAAKLPDGNGGVAYPVRVVEGANCCGTTWGEVIDFIVPTSESFSQKGYFGKGLELCRLDFSHDMPEGSDDRPCDVIHASTARIAFDLAELPEAQLCDKFQILREAESVCPTLAEDPVLDS